MGDFSKLPKDANFNLKDVVYTIGMGKHNRTQGNEYVHSMMARQVSPVSTATTRTRLYRQPSITPATLCV